MSQYTQAIELLAALTQAVNDINTNAKTLAELPNQSPLVPTSLLHVLNGSNSESITLQQIIDTNTASSSLFVGEYDDVAALTTAHPTPATGSRAIIKVASGNDKIAFWDTGGSTWFTQLSSSVEGGSKTLSTNAYESYGDSITNGSGASSGADYVELISSLYNLSSVNRSVSGRGIWESLRLHNLNFNPTDNILTSLMVGFNDVRRGGNDAKTIAKIKNGYRGFICNQFLDRYFSANSGDASLTSSGTWTNYNSASVGGKTPGQYSSVSGNYMEYTFKDNNVVVALISGDGTTSTHGSFDVHIDGVLKGSYTLNNQTDGINDGSNSNDRAPFVLYFDQLSDQEHVIKITHTNSATLPIDYFGNLKQAKFCSPLVLLEAPKMNSAGYATSPALASDLIIDELNTEINNVVSEFSSDFPIFVSKTNDFYNVSNGLGVDNIHPNDIGYRQIYNALYDSVKNVLIDITSVAVDIKPLDNIFTGLNTFTKQIKSSNGSQFQGSLVSPVGEGAEIEYNGGIVYLSALNRTGTVWKPITIRGANTTIKVNNVTKALYSSLGLTITGEIKATTYKSSDGSSGVGGSFTTVDGKTVTVKDGLITAIV